MGKGLRGGTPATLGPAHTLDSSGFFPGRDANSCCCRPEVDTVTWVPSSLSCCLRMAKIKAKQAREPVLKKNWRPTNLEKTKGPVNSGPSCPGLGCPWSGAKWGQPSSPIVWSETLKPGGKRGSPRGRGSAEGTLGREVEAWASSLPCPWLACSLGQLCLSLAVEGLRGPDSCNFRSPPRHKRIPSPLFA